MNDKGFLPLIAILVIVGIGLLLVGWVIVALTMKSMIAIILRIRLTAPPPDHRFS